MNSTRGHQLVMNEYVAECLRKAKEREAERDITSSAYKTATLCPLTRLRDRLLCLDPYRCVFAASLTPDPRHGDP
jgi:hypothetical protein